MKNLFSIERNKTIIKGGARWIGAMNAEKFVQNGVQTYIKTRRRHELEDK